MPFVDAYNDTVKNKIKVVERNEKGERVFREFNAEYVYYYEDPNGSSRTMWGNRCTKRMFNNRQKFMSEMNADIQVGKKIHENSVNPIFRCLYDNYKNKPSPEFNLGFFDIETDFDPERGFAPTTDPFSRITAISIYLTSISSLITFVLKPDLPEDDPDYLTDEEAKAICDKFENTYLCLSEKELLQNFLDVIDDVDVLTGWNSTGYDVPYTTNRILRVLGKSYASKMCLWGLQPKKRKYLRFGKENETFDYVGRVHMDYLELYQKHNPQKMHTYKLDYIGQIEVGENKVPYEGTLDNLYKRDFEKFIAYNRQDTYLIYKIDLKRRYIELHNQLAHSNSVILKTTQGSVAMIDQAITNSVWEKGMQVPAKKTDEPSDDDQPVDNIDDDDDDGEKAAVGAYVADPDPGYYKMIGCVDINSLYPSVLRSLNMGPETIVGQIRPSYTDAFIADRIKNGYTPVDAWHEVFAALEYDAVYNKEETEIVVDFEDGTSITTSGEQFYDFVFGEDSKYIISANGTIFRKDIPSIIAELLAEWYAGRKVQQKNKGLYNDMYGDGIVISEDLMAELI